MLALLDFSELCLLHHKINHNLRQAVPLVGKDDLMVACGLSAALMLMTPLALVSWITQSAARLVAQVGCHHRTAAKVASSSSLTLEKLDDRSGWLSAWAVEV